MQHDLLYHNTEGDYACDKCLLERPDYVGLIEHEKLCWGANWLEKRCPLCDFQMSVGETLPQHIQRECGVCDACNAWQGSAEERRQHRQGCNGNRRNQSGETVNYIEYNQMKLGRAVKDIGAN